MDNNEDKPPTHPPKPRELKRGTSMYMDIRMPTRPERPHAIENGAINEEGGDNEADNMCDPTDRVQDLLNKVNDPKHKTKKVFVEMDILKKRNEDYEWKEIARWVKYEENVEEGGKRWSKPHVASLSMHSIVELRRFIRDSAMLLDEECYTVSQVIDKFLDEWISAGNLDPLIRQHVRNVCLKNHRHRHERGRHGDKKGRLSRQNTETELTRGLSSSNFNDLPSVNSSANLNNVHGSSVSLSSMENESNKKHNDRFLKKIPRGAEVANVLIGEVDDLEQRVCGFLRLNDARILGDICEVPLPSRFIFILLGPIGQADHLQEIGRCIGTMLVDDIFREVAYKCRDKEDFYAGIDEFIEQVTVLPPGEWDPKIRIEPPNAVPSQDFRRTASSVNITDKTVSSVPRPPPEPEDEGHADPSLVISGRPFKGLIDDIKRKAPWYLSDYKDALHIQCLASFVYIFLATLTPNVTFGGILGIQTDQYMGVMECIFAAAVTGIVFAVFSGQPMNILGSTGPMLVLEKIIYNFCVDNGWEFMTFRCWVGIWTAGFLLLIVMFDLSALVKYITRFTEESFACLIALIFIYEAFLKLIEISHDGAPLRLHPSEALVPSCVCNGTSLLPMTNNTMLNDTMSMLNNTNITTTMMPLTTTTASIFPSLNETGCAIYNGTWDCVVPQYVPDAFMFSVLLYFGTFGIAIFLIDFKSWPCFPSWTRQLLSDFGVLIAIVVMVGIDVALGLPTPKLLVPEEFKPTRPDRGWFINPVNEKNPWWTALAAGVPAILATILIFMDQQITAVIVNRKENKLKKGKGYHLDLMVLTLLIVAHSLLGLPWYVAATVSAIAHVQSLKKESESTAPGEKPTFLGVREQRVTALLVGILSGAAVFITNILKIIPMPVLYGVFFYMGFSALRGMQFIDRLMLFLMPVKYQPDHRYLRHVPLWRVHIFTLVQLVCLIALWVVKSIKSISIGFPLLVVFTGVVRKLLECFFTQYELKYLDDILPKKKKNIEKDDKEAILKNDTSPGFKNINSNGKGSIIGTSEKKPNFYLSDEKDVINRKSNGFDNKGFDTKL
ncbi:hypothetical protein SNE40_023048 [Patella caerulea]|uniref:Anion exchange protein n=2 Tax=Patella caerulea TaxID=87958 RepID=A0AAN8IY89_PATCE